MSDKELTKDLAFWPFKVLADKDDNPLIQVEYKGKTERYRPEEISSMILATLKARADEVLM